MLISNEKTKLIETFYLKIFINAYLHSKRSGTHTHTQKIAMEKNVLKYPTDIQKICYVYWKKHQSKNNLESAAINKVGCQQTLPWRSTGWQQCNVSVKYVKVKI